MENNLMDEMLLKLCNDIQSKKNQVINEALNINGIAMPYEDFKDCRFSPISIVQDAKGNQKVYYNNGTKDGLLIVTFHQVGHNIGDVEKEGNSFTITNSYTIHNNY